MLKPIASIFISRTAKSSAPSAAKPKKKKPRSLSGVFSYRTNRFLKERLKRFQSGALLKSGRGFGFCHEVSLRGSRHKALYLNSGSRYISHLLLSKIHPI